jgi:hypothetical protein
MFVLNRPLDYSALPEYYSAALYAFAADNVRPPPMQHQSCFHRRAHGCTHARIRLQEGLLRVGFSAKDPRAKGIS